MVLQRLVGLSDREAVDRFAFDARWKYAAGGLDMSYPSFVHTVLVRMRARLRNSDAPNRIFDIVLDVAKSCGLVGRKRVLDSTPIYDAVATQDTVTLIRSAIRNLLKTTDAKLERKLREVLKRDDDYESESGPVPADGSQTPPAPSSDAIPEATASSTDAQESDNTDNAEIYGDASYGKAEFVEHCTNGGALTQAEQAGSR